MAVLSSLGKLPWYLIHLSQGGPVQAGQLAVNSQHRKRSPLARVAVRSGRYSKPITFVFWGVSLQQGVITVLRKGLRDNSARRCLRKNLQSGEMGQGVKTLGTNPVT